MTKEKELLPIVERWLRASGYEVARECMIGGWCDVIGSMWGTRHGRARPALLETIAIELKLRDIGCVIAQAKGNHHHTTRSYAAMPLDFCKRMRPSSFAKFTDAGVGLLGVHESGMIEVLISSTRNEQEHDKAIVNRLWSFYLRHRKAE